MNQLADTIPGIDTATDDNQLIRALVGRNITRARQEVGMTQERLGEVLGVPRTQVSMWERGRRQPSAHYLKRIADALGHGTDLGFLYSENGKPRGRRRAS